MLNSAHQHAEVYLSVFFPLKWTAWDVCLNQFTHKDAPPTHFSTFVGINLVWILALLAPSSTKMNFWTKNVTLDVGLNHVCRQDGSLFGSWHWFYSLVKWTGTQFKRWWTAWHCCWFQLFEFCHVCCRSLPRARLQLMQSSSSFNWSDQCSGAEMKFSLQITFYLGSIEFVKFHDWIQPAAALSK